MATTAQDRSKDWLAQANLRPTRQRLALAELLVGDGQNRHVTAEWLFEAAQGGGYSVSLATVYNTLRAFCQAGILNEITVDGSRSYFDTRIDEHPHYFWESNGSLSDAPKNAVVFTEEPIAPDGMEIARVDVVIRLKDKASAS